jgi:predicted amidohydrolase
MPDLRVASIQMDAQVGAVEANLARATELVEEAAAQGAKLIVLPEMFAAGYEYTDRNYELPEPLDGPTGTWITRTARRLGVHLVGSFPARMVTGVPDGGRMPGEAYIVAMLAAPDGQRWIYRKIHVAMWENLYFERGDKPVIADTELGRIGLLICWDQVFADLSRAYQGKVDLLCIPSSPPVWSGSLEDGEGQVLASLAELRSLGRSLDGVDWFQRAQTAHARSAGVPLVYAARCGTFHSPIPYGWSFLTMLKPREVLHVLRAVRTRYLLRCPMQGRSCILDARGERLAAAEQEGETVLVATVQPGVPKASALPPVPRGQALIPGIPRFQFWFDRSMITLGRRYHERYRQQTKANDENSSDREDQT